MATDPHLSRNVELACGHDEALATLHRDELTAWCPLCGADVQVSKTDRKTATEQES